MYPEGNKQTNKHMALWSRTSDSTCFQDPGFSSLKWEEPFLLCGFVLKICECRVKYLNVFGTHSTQLSLLRKGSKKLLGWLQYNCNVIKFEWSIIVHVLIYWLVHKSLFAVVSLCVCSSSRGGHSSAPTFPLCGAEHSINDTGLDPEL